MSLVWPILAHLSAEPLVGLKRGYVGGPAEVHRLSAEPLVGLKRRNWYGHSNSCLSAEPLVGLKRQNRRFPLTALESPFSRTPRGFEAERRNGVV